MTQIYIQKLRYITPKTLTKYYNRELPKSDTYYVHDTLLGQDKNNWKMSLNVIKHWKQRYPQSKFYYIIHYSPLAYETYKHNQSVLFENTIHTDDNDLDKITCFDTAHYWFKNKKLPEQLPPNVKVVHFNGLDKTAYQNGREKHTYPNGRTDIIGYELIEAKNRWGDRDYITE